MRLTDGEREFDLLDTDQLTWAEAATVERVTGMKMAEITVQGQVCACSHRLKQHDRDPETGERVCAVCGCDTPMENVSIEVSQALVWVSMKRSQPELTFKQVGEMAAGALKPVDEPEVPEPEVDESDPTGADEALSTTNA